MKWLCCWKSKGWRMVKSETRRDAEMLVRNPSPRLFGKNFRDSKKVKTNHAKTRLRVLSKTLPRFRDPAKIFRDPRFSRYHSPPLIKRRDFFSTRQHSYFGVTHCENSEVQIAVFSKWNMLREWKLVQRFTFCLSST